MGFRDLILLSLGSSEGGSGPCFGGVHGPAYSPCLLAKIWEEKELDWGDRMLFLASCCPPKREGTQLWSQPSPPTHSPKAISVRTVSKNVLSTSIFSYQSPHKENVPEKVCSFCIIKGRWWLWRTGKFKAHFVNKPTHVQFKLQPISLPWLPKIRISSFLYKHWSKYCIGLNSLKSTKLKFCWCLLFWLSMNLLH